MSKISNLPEFVRKELLQKLSPERILQKLAEIKSGDYQNGESYIIKFNSDHPLFEFYYMDMDFLDKNPDDIIKPNSIFLYYFDCLELLKMHFDKIGETINYGR